MVRKVTGKIVPAPFRHMKQNGVNEWNPPVIDQ